MSISPISAPGAQPEPTPSPSSSKAKDFATRFMDFWWIKIPSRLRRYSIMLWAAWSDGIYLTAWPRVATVLLIAVFLFGFAEGATHWSYRTIVGSNGFAGNVLAPSATADGWGGPTRVVFAEILHLLIITVIVGSLSASLGLTLVIGYALGDLLVAGAKLQALYSVAGLPAAQIWVYRHVPLLVSYLLFFALAALPTIMARDLVATAHPKVRQSKPLTIGLTAVVQALLVLGWSYMAPMVFRTVWLWPGSGPRIQVDFYSGVIMRWVLPFVVVAVVARGLLTKLAEPSNSVAKRVAEVARQAESTNPMFPAWGSAVIRAAIITLLMTGFLHSPSNGAPGILASFVEAEIIFVVILAALLVWMYLLPRTAFWSRWTARVNRYPLLVRLAAATAAAYAVTFLLNSVPGLPSDRGGEFGPEVAGILIGFGLTLALLPNGWFAEDQQEITLGSSGRLPVLNSTAAQLASVIAIVLLASRRAFADCNDCHCCFSGCHPWTAGGSVAGSVPPLGGIGTAGKRNPCASQKQAMKDAQNLADSLKAQAYAYQAAMQADAANVKADQAAANSAYSTLQSLLNSLGDDITQFIQGWPSNPADFTNQQLQNMQSTYGSGPYAQQVADLVSAVQKLHADVAKLTNDTNIYNNLSEQYRNAYSAAAQATSAYWDCVISHGGVAPLGAPPPPSLAAPLGAPPPPKSQ